MSKGVGATKLKRVLKAREKQTIRRAAKKLAQFVQALPKISEDDLLSFQFAHFGDDSKPDEWFVKPEDAVEYQPEWDDGLGYYEDGVKRTLTDDEIAVFRRTEEWHLERNEQRKQQADEEERAATFEEPAAKESEILEEPPVLDQAEARAVSPASDASSLEEDLMAYAGVAISGTRPNKSSCPRPPSRDSGINGRSATPMSTSGSNHGSYKKKKKKNSKNRNRTEEVPYDQRHKRKWENFIEDEDPVEGSLTHRRLARELDDQQERRVDMDY